MGYTRARAPWARYQALKEQDANVARYEAWRGGVRGDDRPDGRIGGDGRSCAGRPASPASIAIVGVVLVFVGFLIR